jgi:transcriptional regulator with XRE-family HTH domain
MKKMFFTKMLDDLLEKSRKADGLKYSYTDIQKGTGNAISSEYIRKLHNGSATNPSYAVIEALSAFFGVSPASFFPTMKYRNDRHYYQIVTGLSTLTDHTKFESCVVDLLNKEHPGLVLIPGGGDMGMDGAFPSGNEPFCPVITTISRSAIDNLTRNLKSYLKNDLSSRKVILATSQSLTQTQRKNLINRARELGFEFVAPPYDQTSFAFRLYNNSKWCKELLGITGAPPAISKVPKGSSFFPDLETIARTDAIEWLHSRSGDRILVGEPGMGKTFLLRKLALEDLGLFVVNDNKTEIANDIREYQPELLIVEDAQFKGDLLKKLAQLRVDMGAEFSILISCWPDFVSDFAQEFQISSDNIFKLNRLNRKQMADVIMAMGLKGPDEHIAFILNQVEGRPGLAAVLVWDYMQGDYEKLNNGETITKAILRFIDNDQRKKAKLILAAFSLGGNSGIDKNSVSSELGMSQADVWEIVENLSNCGLVLLARDNISVRPKIMREALVRDIFFSNNRINYQGLVKAVNNKDELAYTLIGARARGGNVPYQLITDTLEKCYSSRPWESFAWLGSREIKWILDQYPNRLLDIAPVALEKIPDQTIPLLLELSIGDNRELHSHPEHPFRKITTWIKEANPGTSQVISRRKSLLNIALEWIRKQNDLQVGLKAIRAALSPIYENIRPHPFETNKIGWTHYVVTSFEVREISTWFDESLSVISETTLEPVHWKIVSEMIEDWAYPGRINSVIPDETYNLMRDGASILIRLLLPLAEGLYGVLLNFKRISNHLGLEIEINLPQEFELLFEEVDLADYEDWRTLENKRKEKIDVLGNELCRESPSKVSKLIVNYANEAHAFHSGYPNRLSILCASIAENVDNPEEWVAEVGNADLDIACKLPFLRKWIELDQESFEKFSAVNLSDPNLGIHIKSLVICTENISDDLLNQTLNSIDGDENSILQAMYWRDLSEKALNNLINHPNPKISGLAALYEWRSDPKETVREEVEKEWKKAILNINANNISNFPFRYEFEKILLGDQLLAYAWLEKQLKNNNNDFHEPRKIFVKAASILEINQRQNLIRLIPNSYDVRGLAAALVGNDIDTYRILLDRPEIKLLHLAPLFKPPDETWIEMAILAQRKGYSSDEIAQGVIYQLPGVINANSSAWLERISVFETLASHQERTIAEIGVVGKEYCENQYKQSLQEEQFRQVYGYG